MKLVRGREYFVLEALDYVPIETQALFKRAWVLCPTSFKFNLIKVEKKHESVTLAFYPHLGIHPHPFLQESLKIDLKTNKISRKRESKHNPVILHRIESMLPPGDPRIPQLEEVTKKEEELGMYHKDHINFIGRRSYWNELCEANNLLDSRSPIIKVQTTGEQILLFDNPPLAVQRAKTAMHIKTPSQPTKLLLKEVEIKGSIFDWGCGNERDTRYLQKLGHSVYSYDKFLKPIPSPSEVDFKQIGIIICNYVINVIESPVEREELLVDIFNHAQLGAKILISARSFEEIETNALKGNWKVMADGYVTQKNTFQKGFHLSELIELTEKFGTVIIGKKSPNWVLVIVEKNKP